jgi:hypothetical protein
MGRRRRARAIEPRAGDPAVDHLTVARRATLREIDSLRPQFETIAAALADRLQALSRINAALAASARDA